MAMAEDGNPIAVVAPDSGDDRSNSKSKDVRPSKRRRFGEDGGLFNSGYDFDNTDDEEEFAKLLSLDPDDDEGFEKRLSFLQARGRSFYTWEGESSDDEEDVVMSYPSSIWDGNTDMDIRPFAEMALSGYNEKILAQQGTEYELVEVLECVKNEMPSVFHFNFIAKPKTKNGSEEDKKELFFGEVQYNQYMDKGKGGFCCSCCCIVGPSDTETGLGECLLMCVHHRGRVKHPVDGFTKDTGPDSPGASPIPIFCPIGEFCSCREVLEAKGHAVIW